MPIKHASITGAAANPRVLVDGPKWDANHDLSSLTASEVNFTASGTGASARTVQSRLLDRVANVRDFGAVGDGLTDDTAAIQAAITQAQALTNGYGGAGLYLPRATAAYLISSSLTATKALCIRGDGPTSSVITSNSNIPYFTLDTTSNDMYDGEISGLGFLTGNSGTRTSEACIKATGSHLLTYWNFENLHCLGVYRFFDLTGLSGTCQWTSFVNNKSRNSGALTTHDWLYVAGGGLGSCFVANNIVYATANGIQIGDGTVNVGDLVIANNQFNTCADAINLRGGTSYGTNVQIVGNDMDAGVTNAITLDNMGNVVGRANSFGGATSISIANSRGAGTTQSPSIHIDRYETFFGTITASQNDYNPSGMSRVGRLVIASNGNYNITGITAMQEDRRLEIYNSSAFTITLVDASGSSTAANRFDFGGTSHVLPAGASVKLYYNTSTLRWQVDGFGNKAITYNRLQDAAALTVLGNSTGGAAAVTEIQASGENRILARKAGALSFTASPILGEAGATAGSLGFQNATSGQITVQPVTGALGSVTLSLPARTDTVVTLAGTEELTNKTVTSAVAKGTWTVSGTWTIPAVTLGGDISGGGKKIDNAIIGSVTPLAGSFTTLTSAGDLNVTDGFTKLRNATTGNLFNVYTSLASGVGGGSFVAAYTKSLPSAADHRLGGFLCGYTADEITVRNSGLIGVYSSEAWTAGSAQGTYIDVQNTANTTASRTSKVRFHGSGGVTVGNGILTTDPGAGALALSAYVQPGSFTVGTLPTGATGAMVWSSNCRVFNGAGTQEGAASGTGGLVTYNGSAWKIAGTNVTAVA